MSQFTRINCSWQIGFGVNHHPFIHLFPEWIHWQNLILALMCVCGRQPETLKKPTLENIQNKQCTGIKHLHSDVTIHQSSRPQCARDGAAVCRWLQWETARLCSVLKAMLRDTEIDVVKDHIRLSAVSWFFYSSPIWVYCIFEYTLLQQGSKAQNKFTKEIKRNTETSGKIEFTSQVKTREPLSMFQCYSFQLCGKCFQMPFGLHILKCAPTRCRGPKQRFNSNSIPKERATNSVRFFSTSATITYKPAASQRNRTLAPQGNTC